MSLKDKIDECISMFEVIYSKRKELNVGIIRLWKLKKLRDKVRSYKNIVDLDDPKYFTKKVIRDINYTYLVFRSILEKDIVHK